MCFNEVSVCDNNSTGLVGHNNKDVIKMIRLKKEK